MVVVARTTTTGVFDSALLLTTETNQIQAAEFTRKTDRFSSVERVIKENVHYLTKGIMNQTVAIMWYIR
jgi:hypothetical protein